MPVIPLPPGCQGLEVGGRTYKARTGTSDSYVNVSDEHAAAIRNADTGGILTGGFQVTSVGTRKGRWCMACSPPRLWNAWNHECPKCHTPTTPE